MARRAITLYHWPYGHCYSVTGPTGHNGLLLLYYWPYGPQRPYYSVTDPTGHNGLITSVLALRAITALLP